MTVSPFWQLAPAPLLMLQLSWGPLVPTAHCLLNSHARLSANQTCSNQLDWLNDPVYHAGDAHITAGRQLDDSKSLGLRFKWL